LKHHLSEHLANAVKLITDALGTCCLYHL